MDSDYVNSHKMTRAEAAFLEKRARQADRLRGAELRRMIRNFMDDTSRDAAPQPARYCGCRPHSEP